MPSRAGAVMILIVAAALSSACGRSTCGGRRCTPAEVCLRAEVYQTGAPIVEECVALPSRCRECRCAEAAAFARAAAVHPFCGAIPYRPLCLSEAPNLAVRVQCAR